MLLTIQPSVQEIVTQPGVSAPLPSISVPRATSVPIVAQFYDDGAIFDPEALTTAITGSSVAAASLITCPSPHGLTSTNSVTIAGHTGVAKAITAVAISSMAVTMTSAITGVVTLPAAGALAAGDTVVFTTDGALPTNIVAGTIYFVKTALTPTTFTVSAVNGGTAINTTAGTQSGVHTAAFSVSTVTAAAHGLSSADTVAITGVTGATPGIAGSYVVRVIDADNFTVPVAVTVAGGGGTVTKATSTPDINGVRVVTVIDATSFTIPVNVTSAGAGGTVTKTTALALRWTVKALTRFDGAIVASCSVFTKSGSGTTTRFTGHCNYITNELNSLLGIDPATSGTYTVTATSATIGAVAHGFTVGDTVVFSAGTTMPGGLVSGQTYYIKTTPNADSITVAATATGTAITITSAGVGALTYAGYQTVDDVEQASCMAELSWLGAVPSKTNWVAHYVRNDLYKGNEDAPVSPTSGADGKTAIINGAQELVVAFPAAFTSDQWHLLGSPVIRNTMDGSPLGIFPTIMTARSAAGFTYALSGAVDSGNYAGEWSARLD